MNHLNKTQFNQIYKSIFY